MNRHFDRIFWDDSKKKLHEKIVDLFLLDLYHAGYDPDILDTKRGEYLQKVKKMLTNNTGTRKQTSSTSLDQLDLEFGLKLKEEGMAKAAAKNADFLEEIDVIAKKIVSVCGEVHADAIHDEIIANDLKIPKGAFWGSIFKRKEWEFTGNRIKSSQPKNHGREIKVWRLRRDR